MRESRQVQRRKSRELEKENKRKFSKYNPETGNRKVRRLSVRKVRDIFNTRKTTSGRRVYYQFIYDVIDTKGKIILSFGTTSKIIGSNKVPKKIRDKIFSKIFDKKRDKLKREVAEIKLNNVIKHNIPSEHYIKIQKIIIEKSINLKK